MGGEIMNSGYSLLGIMPVIGLGTWDLNGPGCVAGVISALNMGYRHIDTAQIYGNEREVGRAIGASGLKREEIFLTTKVATGNLTPSRIVYSTGESLKRLGTDYVDLLLIHWPTEVMNLHDCLATMFELKEKGLVRYVGVSNFNHHLFMKAIDSGPVLTNQVRLTPYHPETENLQTAHKNNKIITAYSPLGRGSLANDRLLAAIGNKYRKSASQVALRWLIQLGNVSVIPKASGERHQKENISIFDFELSGEDMSSIRQLGK
jgi:diketogulonate reductase-like aldo/keto reductase